uniref:Putative secreted protein n=1 Tax=Ixodes ricinus TaxID=34613 RepID=A0A147BUL1_IXORI
MVSFFRFFFFFLVCFVGRSLFVWKAVYRNFSCCSNLHCLTIWQICVLCCQGNEYVVCNDTCFLSLVFGLYL